MEKEKVNQQEELTKEKNWFQSHLWLLAAIAGLFVLFGMCGPFVLTKPLIATEADGWWTFTKEVVLDDQGEQIKRIGIFADGIFGAGGHSFNWAILIAFILAPLGSIFAIFGKKNSKLSMAAMFLFLISAILFLMSAALFDLGETKALTGSLSAFEDMSAMAGTKMSFGSIWAFSFSLAATALAFNEAYQGQNSTISDITEIAVLCALAIVLDSVEHFIPDVWAGGGGIGFKLVPLYFIALRFGPLYGFIAGGIIFGLITSTIDGYGIQYFPLDYLAGFGAIGVAGFFKPLIFGKNQKNYNVLGELMIIPAVFIPAIIRFLASTTSGVIVVGLDWNGSVAYNVTYIFVTAAISCVVLMAVYGPLVRVNRAFPIKKEYKN